MEAKKGVFILPFLYKGELMKKIIICITSFVLLFSSLGLETISASETKREHLLELMNNMTIEEKIGQMIQPDTRSITPEEVAAYNIGSILSGGGASPSTGNSATDWADRLDAYQKAAIEAMDIPLLYGVDAVHGHNNVDDATIFPHNINLGMSGDTALVKEIGAITAKEMRATGANWTFTPTVGIPKNERWGRTYETYGEDKDLVSRLGSAYIQGSQQDFNPNSALATAKHFIGEGITTNGVNQGDVPYAYDSEEFQTILRNELLVPYKEAIANNVSSIMITYNSINGMKVHGSKALIQELLKDELGFEGIVISDYNGIDQIEGNLSYQDKVIQGVNAGIDVLMVDDYDNGTPKWLVIYNTLVDAVDNNQVSIERVDDAVYRVLKAKDDLGLLEDVDSAYADRELLTTFGSQEHREVAQKAVRSSLTLLKNTATENNSTTLLDLKDANKIVVAGSAGDDIGIQSGGWTISWQGSQGNITEGTTIYQGLKQFDSNKQVDYVANGFFEEEYDYAVVVVGEMPYAEYAGDKTPSELKLSSQDTETIERIHREHPDLPIVAVLVTGRPITIAEVEPYMDAIVMAGLPGSEGAGIADVLLGDYDFEGSLTITWPWYAQNIDTKFSNPDHVMFEYGRSLSKHEVTPLLNSKPNSPQLIDLEETEGIIAASNFIDKHSEVRLENNDTSIGYYWEDRYVTYLVDIPQTGRYSLSLLTATANDGINIGVEVYVDNVKHSIHQAALPNTGAWNNFEHLELDNLVSLPEGIHEIKMVSKARDFNVQQFKLTYVDDDYEEPTPEEKEDNTGTGNLLSESAVYVSMSSSEKSQSMSWYKGNQYIENKNSEKEKLDLKSIDSSNIQQITINQNKTFQPVLGIGTSVEESTVNNLMKMDEETRTKFIHQLVDPIDGMGNTLFRVTIGTSDFTSKEFYTYYDGTGTELNGQPDWYNETGNGFSIQKDIDNGIIDVIHEIQEAAIYYGVEDEILFFASSWTPPGWMKTPTSSSDSYPNNELLLKGGRLNDAYISDLAKYYVRFIEEYQKLGIPMYALTLQNEPLLEINYPSCYITGSQEAVLAKYIKEHLSGSNVLNEEDKDVKVWAFDHNFDGAQSYVDDLFSSEDGRNNVDGIAFHPYGGNPSTMGSLYNEYQEDYTMHLTERSVWGTSGASDIISWFRNGSQSYNGWVTMLDSHIQTHQWVGTPDPTMFVQDANNPNTYWSTPEVYIIGQFSKYIRPGFERIDSSLGSNSTINNVAFKNPETGEIVLVVTNPSGKDQDFKVVVDGAQFNATLPSGNVGTYIWTPIDNSQIKDITDELLLTDMTLTGSGVVENDAVGYIDETTTLDYFVNVREPGFYRVSLDVAVGGDWDVNYPIDIKQNDTTLGSAHASRYVFWDDAQWNTYAPTETIIELKESGLQHLQLTFPQGGMNFKGVRFTKTKPTIHVPGKLDTTNFIDQKGIVLENENSNFGFIDYDDYIDFPVVVEKTGTYLFQVLAATTTTSGVWIDSITEEGSTYIGEMHFTSSGDLNTYVKFTSQLLLEEGEQTLRIKFKNNNTNFKSMVIGQSFSLQQDTIEKYSIDGSVLRVELEYGTFAETLNPEHWTINTPQGVSTTLSRINDTTVEITLQGETEVDFDYDLSMDIIVSFEEFGGIEGTTLHSEYILTAIYDEESLIITPSVEYGQKELSLTIEGGTFNTNVSEHISFDDNIARFVEIEEVEIIDSRNLILHLKWKPLYEDYAGTITVGKNGYESSKEDLTVETVFKKSDELPESIKIEDSVTLTDFNSYRNKGSIQSNVEKGNYEDFYINIPREGNYRLVYQVSNESAISNALKISGGMGLATDNLASISFSNFWNNQVGYHQLLHLKEGEQTLRFEVNSPGYRIHSIMIEEISPTSLNEDTTLTAGDVVDGSKDKAWAIEEKNGIHGVGFTDEGSSQDYWIDVKEAGEYEVSILAAGDINDNAQAYLSTSKDILRTNTIIPIKNTGDWGKFEESEKVQMNLSKGEQKFTLKQIGSGFNYQAINFKLVERLDTVAPIISGNDTKVLKGDTRSFKDILSLNILDEVDGEIVLDSEYVVIESNFDVDKVGSYTIKVIASDTSNNTSERTFTIEVVEPISYVISNTIYYVGDVFDPLLDLKVYGNYGEDITDLTKIISNEVDTSKLGSYLVIYEVEDSLNNKVTIQRTVRVLEKEVDLTQAKEQTIQSINEWIDNLKEILNNKESISSENYESFNQRIISLQQREMDNIADCSSVDEITQYLNSFLNEYEQLKEAIQNHKEDTPSEIEAQIEEYLQRLEESVTETKELIHNSNVSDQEKEKLVLELESLYKKYIDSMKQATSESELENLWNEYQEMLDEIKDSLNKEPEKVPVDKEENSSSKDEKEILPLTGYYPQLIGFGAGLLMLGFILILLRSKGYSSK